MAREIDRDEARRTHRSRRPPARRARPRQVRTRHTFRARSVDASTTLTQRPPSLGDDLDREIVVYCTDQACTGSALAAKLLEGRGYRNVLRYTDGLADWSDAGLPVPRPVGDLTAAGWQTAT